MITACMEHIEIALDEFVDTYEEPPEMERIEEQESQTVTCQFCDQPAKFRLRKPEEA